MGEIKYLAGILAFILFTLAIVGYAMNFGIDNDAVINLNEDSNFNSLNTQITGNLSYLQTSVDSESQSLISASIETGGDNMETGQAFKLGIFPMIYALKSVTQTIKEKIFGGSVIFGIFLTALVSLTIYTGIRYIWKTWKGGNPD